MDGMLSGDPALWESTVDTIQALPRKQHADLWGAMLSRLARDPPPIQGDLSQDQWLNLCREHYRELYACATNKQPTQYVNMESGAVQGAAHGGAPDLGNLTRPLNEIRVAVERVGDPVEAVRAMNQPLTQIRDLILRLGDPGAEIRGLAAPVEEVRQSVAALQDPIPDIRSMLQSLDAIRDGLGAVRHPGSDLGSLLQPLNDISTRINQIQDPVPVIRTLLQPLTETSNNVSDIKTMLQPLGAIVGNDAKLSEISRVMTTLNSLMVELQNSVYTRVMGNDLNRQLTAGFGDIDGKVRNTQVAIDRSDSRNERCFETITRLLEDIKSNLDQPIPALSHDSQEKISQLQSEIAELKSENEKLTTEEVSITPDLWGTVWNVDDQKQQFDVLKSEMLKSKHIKHIGIIGLSLEQLNDNIRSVTLDVSRAIVTDIINGVKFFFAPKELINDVMKWLRHRISALIRGIDSKPNATANDLKYKSNLELYSILWQTCLDKTKMFPASLLALAINTHKAMDINFTLIKYKNYGVLSTGKTLLMSSELDMFQISTRVADDLTKGAQAQASVPLNWDSDSWFSSFS